MKTISKRAEKGGEEDPEPEDDQTDEDNNRQEEEEARALLNCLSWAVPLAVLLASLVDLVLVALYQKFFHPWRRILEYVEKDPTYRRITSSEQYQMSKESVTDFI